MKPILIEFVFGMIMLLSYLSCGKDFSLCTMIAMFFATERMLFRMMGAKYDWKEIKNSRRATYLWMLPHIIVCIMVAIKDDYLSIIVAFGIGAFLFSLLYEIIKQGEIKPFDIVEIGTVKRKNIYAICVNTFFICFIDLMVRYSVINLVFTALVAVGMVVYTEIAIKIINKDSESK